MLELFAMDELVMMGIVLFASFWLFLFNYRMDNKEKYEGHKWLIGLDLVINMGMSLTGYLLILQSKNFHRNIMKIKYANNPIIA